MAGNATPAGKHLYISVFIIKTCRTALTCRMADRMITFMNLREVADLLEAEVISGGQHLDHEFEFAGASDLMSDILAFSESGILLLTGLANTQSVHTAEIIEAKAIVYVRVKKPSKEGIALAEKKNIPILSTKFLMYKACGLLYNRGIRGVRDL
jgi:predicted transcriptional regulator